MPLQVIARKGKNNVYIISNGNRVHMTAVVCGNAKGVLTQTLIINKGIRPNDKHTHAWPGAMYTQNENGYMANDIWLEWCKNFVKETKPTAAKPVLLIADQHDSRCYLPAIEYLANHHVALLCLPPHTTHRLQPLDVGFFGPFKRYLRRMARGKRTLVSRDDLAGMVRDALAEVSKIHIDPVRHKRTSTLINAFRGTGIYPYNPSVIEESEYGLSDHLTKQRLELAATEGIIDLSNPDIEYHIVASALTPEMAAAAAQDVLLIPDLIKVTLKKVVDGMTATRRGAEVMTGFGWVRRRLAKIEEGQKAASDKTEAAEAKKAASAARKAQELLAKTAKRAAKQLAKVAASTPAPTATALP